MRMTRLTAPALLALITLTVAGCIDTTPTWTPTEETETWLTFPGETAPKVTYTKVNQFWLEPTRLTYRQNDIPMMASYVQGVTLTYTSSGLVYPVAGHIKNETPGRPIYPVAVFWNGATGRAYDWIEYLTVERLESCRINSSQRHRDAERDANPRNIEECADKYNGRSCICKGDGLPLYIGRQGTEHFVVLGAEEYGPYGPSDIITNLVVTHINGKALPEYDILKLKPGAETKNFRHIIPGVMDEERPASQYRSVRQAAFPL